LPVVLYKCETWSLTLRKERRLTPFENRLLRRIFEPKRFEETGEWRKLHNEELHDPITQFFSVDKIENKEMGGHVARMKGAETYAAFCWGKFREREHLVDSGLNGGVILRWMFRKWDVGVWTGSTWLRIGTGGGNL